MNDYRSRSREIMHLVASDRLFALSRLNRLTYYQSKVFVGFSLIRGHADAVNRLLIAG